MPEPAVVTQSTALSDEEVVSRVLGGDTALFEVLMRRHNQRIYRAVRAVRIVRLMAVRYNFTFALGV